MHPSGNEPSPLLGIYQISSKTRQVVKEILLGTNWMYSNHQ